MSPRRWNATVVDAPGSEPYTIMGDVVVAVRTPRSRDFVTVEIALVASDVTGLVVGAVPGSGAADGVTITPRPAPLLTSHWQGEVHVGAPVGIRLAGESYRLTLARLEESPNARPWIACDFCLERG
jgi:hypothetical protein